MTFLKTSLAVLGACTVLANSATSVAANPGDVEYVTEGLISAGIAVELGDQCDDVRVRLVRGLNFLQGLKTHLKDLGYTNAQIDAFIDNRVEKDRLEAIARQRLVALGAQVGNPASYCTVARAQIAQGTQVGQLLR